MSIGKFEFETTGKTTAYLRLPNHPGILKGARSVPLVDIMGAYDGPYIVFDFDPKGSLVGIEIVGDDVDDESDEVE